MSTHITEINKLIDSHPDSYVGCEGCEKCDKIQELMKNAPKKRRKGIPEIEEQLVSNEPVKHQRKLTKEIYEEAAKRGISETLLRGRVYNQGMSIHEALHRPLKAEPPFSKEEKARAKANGISYATLMARHYKGWDKERAMTEPAVQNNGKKPVFTKEEREEAAKNGIPYVTLMQRYKAGWDKHTAMTQPPNQKYSKNKKPGKAG